MGAKDFYQLISAKAGFAGEYEALTETEIATAPGSAYTPGNDPGVFRTVPSTAGRTVQLLDCAPVFIETFQNSDATLRFPSGTIGTNDAEDGRFFFIKNNGAAGTDSDGDLFLEKSDGTLVTTLGVGFIGIALHGDNDEWDVAIVNEQGPGTDGFGGVYRYTSNSGVPGGGVLFLSTGDSVRCSDAGDRLIDDITVGGISIRVDAPDGGKDFEVQVVENPSGVSGPLTVVATLQLPAGSVSEGRADLSEFVTAPTEIGVRIVKIAGGGGGSSFNKINVNVQVR
ncbi:MAG: hypothetical protein ACXABY_04650 [Candidatus Thorarchaeota archaeon]|jgi:hypothetical protein